MHRSAVLIGGAVALAACASSTPESPPPLPTPFPEIATTAELEAWATERILSFRETKKGDSFIGFGLQTLAHSAALESATAQNSELILTSVEPPAGWFATPLGRQPVVFIVNADNPQRELTSDEIIDVFAGRTVNWQKLGGPDLAIQAVIPLQGAETRNYLQQGLLADRRFTSSALLGPTPEAVISLVQENLGAIGILPLSAASGDVSLVSIDGHNPLQEGGYPFMLEVLGIAPEEPDGIVREWLAWLQETY